MKRNSILTAILVALALAFAGGAFASDWKPEALAESRPESQRKSARSYCGASSEADGRTPGSVNLQWDNEASGKKIPGSPATGARVAAVLAHKSIDPEAGPASCYVCHEDASQEMFDRLLRSQTDSEPPAVVGFGKGKTKRNFKGVESFCAYAPYAKGSCYNCHVKSAASSQATPSLKDLDCLICHDDAA